MVGESYLHRGGMTSFFFMSKNQITKEELKVRVLKLKHQLYTEHIQHDMDMKGLAHKYLDKVLYIIDEYRY